MPVLVKDYEWEETETNVLIKVALKGIHSSKADVLTSSEYLKVKLYFFSTLFRKQLRVRINFDVPLYNVNKRLNKSPSK